MPAGGLSYSSEAGNGFLEYNGKIESLTHVFMKHLKINESELVALIWGIEVAMCAIVISVDIIL